jgi:hypothetical protein
VRLDRLRGLVSIPTGAILALVRDRKETGIYITVQWNDREVLVFVQDLSERAVECDISPETAA